MTKRQKNKKKKKLICSSLLFFCIVLGGVAGYLKISNRRSEDIPEISIDLLSTEEAIGVDEQSLTIDKNENDSFDLEKTDVTITYSIETDTRTNDSGIEIISYQYPVFSCDNSAYNEVISEINEKYAEIKEYDLESDMSDFAMAKNSDAVSFPYFQEINNISIEKGDKYISINVSRTQEVGGTYPHNLSESYVIDVSQATFAKLTDVVDVNEEIIEEITSQVYSEHSDKEFDTLKKDIAQAINDDRADWIIRDGQLVISFAYEDITGAYQGDGEYAAIIPVEN